MSTLSSMEAMERSRDAALEGWSGALKRIAELERELAGLKADRDHYQSENVRLVRKLAARPVVEGEAARRLREAWAKAPLDTREHVSNATWSYWGGMELVRAMRAFLESAPPASAASEDAAHWKAMAFQHGSALTECQRERDSANERARILTEQLNDQAARHGEEGERWSKEMGAKDEELRSLRAELAALKAASAPAGCAGQSSDYVRAAVEWAEALIDDEIAFDEAKARERAFEALYDARKRGEQEKVGCASDAGSIMLNRPTHPTLDVVAPAPAPAERVTVYVHRVNANKFRPAPAEIVLFSKDFTGGEYSCIGTLALARLDAARKERGA